MAADSTSRTCAADGCEVRITRRSRTGLCRPHALAAQRQDPAFRARQRAGIERHFAQPGVRDTALARMNAGRARWRAGMSEEEKAREQAHGRWLYEAHASRPEIRALAVTPEVLARRIAGYLDSRFGWCPRSRRDHYRMLRAKDVPAAEARRMIEAEIEQDRVRARRELAAHEQVMRDRQARDRRDAY